MNAGSVTQARATRAGKENRWRQMTHVSRRYLIATTRTVTASVSNASTGTNLHEMRMCVSRPSHTVQTRRVQARV